MSIVCCKISKNKIEIASDSITVSGWMQTKEENLNYAKLVRVNGIVIGGVGETEEISLFQTYCHTRRPKSASEDNILEFLLEFADWKKKKTEVFGIENQYIISFDHKAYVTEGLLVREIINYWAIGAGTEYALSALYLGHSVNKAIETACELSIYCEKPIKIYEISKDNETVTMK